MRAHGAAAGAAGRSPKRRAGRSGSSPSRGGCSWTTCSVGATTVRPTRIGPKRSRRSRPEVRRLIGPKTPASLESIGTGDHDHVSRSNCDGSRQRRRVGGGATSCASFRGAGRDAAFESEGRGTDQGGRRRGRAGAAPSRGHHRGRARADGGVGLPLFQVRTPYPPFTRCPRNRINPTRRTRQPRPRRVNPCRVGPRPSRAAWRGGSSCAARSRRPRPPRARPIEASEAGCPKTRPTLSLPRERT